MIGPQMENTLSHVLWDHGKQEPDHDGKSGPALWCGVDGIWVGPMS